MNNTNIAVAARFAATVVETKTFGVIVRLADSDATALLHTTRMAGGGNGARARRFRNLVVGATTEVEVVGVEGEGKRRKVSVSEKSLQDARVLAELKPGTAVVGEVVGKREFGAFVRLLDGVAADVEGLVHVTELPGAATPQARDKALADLAIGTRVNAEVLAVSQDDAGDLRVSLSLRAEERRVVASRYGVGTVHTGRVVKRLDEAFLVSFGTVTGVLPFTALGKAGAGSVRVGGNVRARIEELDERMRAQLSRRGL
jgi:ribosomal protein S1